LKCSRRESALLGRTKSREFESRPWGTEHRREHHEPHFRCRFTFIVDGKPFEGASELVTDGREVTHTERGRLTVSTLRWDGEALVSTDRSEGTISFRYELLDTGHRLRLTEQIRGTDHDQDNLWIFERR
jgi:hypothetical protein